MHEKITSDGIFIERLNNHHNIADFKSYEPELVDFLIEDAPNNQKQKLSVTFLFFYKSQLASYITLLTDKINLEGNLKSFFREKGILYKSLPALKIGRLCVDDRFLRRGLGTLMISFSIAKANDILKRCAGCRFITIDAKRNSDKSKDSIHFYKRLGFRILKERRKGLTPMYLDLNPKLNL